MWDTCFKVLYRARHSNKGLSSLVQHSLFCCVLCFSVFFLYEKPPNSRGTMASISQFNQLRCKVLPVSPPNSHLTPKPSISLPCVVEFSGTPIRNPRNSAARPAVRVRATTDDDEWGSEKEEKQGDYGEGSSVAVAEEEKEEKAVEATEIERLKKALVDSFYGTDRGLKATSETRAEIVELITQLEARNPTPAPTEALTLLNGKWILA